MMAKNDKTRKVSIIIDICSAPSKILPTDENENRSMKDRPASWILVKLLSSIKTTNAITSVTTKGITQYKLIPSLGATETYPFIGSSEVISDISSTGKTLEDNNLRVLKDGLILKTTACLFISKQSRKYKKSLLSDFYKLIR